MRKKLLGITALASGALLAPVVVPVVASNAATTSAVSTSRSSLGHGMLAQAQREAVARFRSGAAGTAQRSMTATSAAGPTVVVSGLNNPRQLSLLSGQDVLLVAEAGRGGSACTGSGQDQTCVGATGAISAVLGPQTASSTKPLRIVERLLSGAGPDGSGAVGSDGVSARTLNRIYVQMTWAPPDVIPQGLPGDQAGKLLRTRPFGPKASVADLAAHEAAHDPDHQGFDSDPYAVLVLPHRILVADAAGNDILSVDPRTGRISTFAVLPNINEGACKGAPNDAGTVGCDAVPTSLAVGPHGAIYVGGLGGEAPGTGRVWRLNPRTGNVQWTWRHLTTVTGVAVDRWGAIYASELFGGSDPDLPGAVVKIPRYGNRTTRQVPLPAGLAVDRWRNVYVSAFSLAPATGLGVPGMDTSGQVWRLRF
ncbi:MAG: ScyD/ScyE family protein [Frankiaceae bacterium]